MIILRPEQMESLTEERRESILRRSMEDISSVYLEVRDIVQDIQKRGDAVSVEHYTKFKASLCAEDILVTKEEIEKAYQAVDNNIVKELKNAAKNIEKFH